MNDKEMADAVRLAAKLRININPLRSMNGKDTGWSCWPAGRGDCMFDVPGNDAESICQAIIESTRLLKESSETGVNHE